MSFFGSIFGGKRKHEEKMEKIKRDEMKEDEKMHVYDDLAKEGINPFGSGASAVLGGAAKVVGAATPLVGMALGVPPTSGLSGLFGGLFGASPSQNGAPAKPPNMMLIYAAGALVLILLLFKKK